ncbi:hypothetical protein KY284_002620 [Solanum tuberosum]|nr:hypothetical protein KY284_002620 [Solanum tuberosum]
MQGTHCTLHCIQVSRLFSNLESRTCSPGLCTSAIGQLTKGRNKEDKESPELQSLSAMALEKNYKLRAPSRLSVLSSTLRSLKI